MVFSLHWQQDQIKLTRIKKRKYIEFCFKQILRQKGVLNAFVFDENGVPRQSTIERMETIRHIGLIQEIIIKSKRALQTIEQHNDFESLRVRSRKFEILVSKDDDLYFVVYQNAPGTFHRFSLDEYFLNFFLKHLLEKTVKGYHCLQIYMDDGW